MNQEVLARSLLSRGNTARLQRVLARAARGETVVIGAIGGSITAGGASSDRSRRYADLLGDWWREQFPQAHVELVNAGLGGTGSNFGCHRVGIDLLAKQPDFVVVEFAVNDANEPQVAETMEGLVRQILTQPNLPAVVLLFMMAGPDEGRNAQAWHAQIGHHYGLGMVSFRDALWPEVQAGHIAWQDIIADTVHPNDRGHALAARFLEHYLTGVVARPADDPAIAPLPAARFTDAYEYTAMRNAGTIRPIRQGVIELLRHEGWRVVPDSRHGPAWVSETPGSELEFSVLGSHVSVVFHRRRQDIGVAQAWVDDRPPVRLEGLINAQLANNSYTQLVASDLDDGPHHLRIRLLDAPPETGRGRYFEVRMVTTAGAPHYHGSMRP